MPISSAVKDGLNRLLKPFNLQLGTLTRARAETARLSKLAENGQFQNPAFPLLPQYEESRPDTILEWVRRHRAAIDEFSASSDGTRYSLDNSYFTSPDADVAYAMVRETRPRHIIEVGSGNSTMLFREAIRAGALDTKLISIDPHPRRSIGAFADKVLECPVEEVALTEFAVLASDDILFIDSSHEIRTGNDVVHLFLNVLPMLPAGILVHVHDIFLPFDYPQAWVCEHQWGFNEQYLVQALLQDSHGWEVLWAGHFLERTMPGFPAHFPHMKGRHARSLWLRKRA
jgi:predicted O-methyltransferase YrrM